MAPETARTYPTDLPVLALRHTLVFPLTLQPLAVNRPMSIEAVNRALAADRLLFLALQHGDEDDPHPDHLHKIGTIAAIRQMAKVPAGGVHVIVEGLTRARAEAIVRAESMLRATVAPQPDEFARTLEVDAYVRRLQELIDRALSVTSGLSQELRTLVMGIDDPLRLAYLLASLLDLKGDEKQQILEATDLIAKLKAVADALNREIALLELKGKIESAAQQEMTDAQRQYFLRQQLKAIQDELGEGEKPEAQELRTRVAEARLPEGVAAIANREIDRLERMGPASPEYQMIRTYIDWVLDVPWSKTTADRLDLVAARAVLDEDHYDLDKVKDRIVEYLAVQKLKNDQHMSNTGAAVAMKGPILCFVGAPGVGKTSLGQSIARSMNRKFVRISLGGVRDEAEIRGHRRTYIGSLPGRLVQALKTAGSANPVLMLDEIDKISVGVQGDPAAALLEVLDPAQNHTFRDHYLEIPIDLSQVLFIATANQLGTIHPALMERMVLITLAGYTEEEKIHIAKMYLVPRQLDEHGLKPDQLTLDDEALRRVIAEYTREAGVRSLERQIGTIARKVAARVTTDATHVARVTARDIMEYLGPARFRSEGAFRLSRAGVATGLAWTETGGDVIYIEAVLLPGGNGHLTLTGQLGSVMQESARAALSHVRQQAQALGIPPDVLSKQDLHIHVPAGAIPKDGPSAGVTMATAIVSAARGVSVRPDVAMTGEITLSGLVLPVGGIREKSLAARRHGIKTVVLPQMNSQDLVELPEEVRRDMTFVPAATLEDVLRVAVPDVVDAADNAAATAGGESPAAAAAAGAEPHR